MPQGTQIVHGQLFVTKTSTSVLAALLSIWVAHSICWYIELFLPRCWTLHFYLLNSMRLLSAHFLSLSRSFCMAAWPGFTCCSYSVTRKLDRCSFSDRSSTAGQTKVSKTLDNLASPCRLYHTKLFNTSYAQENLSEPLPSLRLASNQGAYEFQSEMGLFQFSPCKQNLCHLSLVCLFTGICSSKWSTCKCLVL